jgi:hypothetical protein
MSKDSRDMLASEGESNAPPETHQYNRFDDREIALLKRQRKHANLSATQEVRKRDIRVHPRIIAARAAGSKI